MQPPEDKKLTILHEIEHIVLNRSLSTKEKTRRMRALESRAARMPGISLTDLLEVRAILKRRLSPGARKAELEEIKRVFVGAAMKTGGIRNPRYWAKGFDGIAAKEAAHLLRMRIRRLKKKHCGTNRQIVPFQ